MVENKEKETIWLLIEVSDSISNVAKNEKQRFLVTNVVFEDTDSRFGLKMLAAMCLKLHPATKGTKG